MENDLSRLPPPPRLIATLAHGFDVVANRLLLILPPVLLDLFLWQGPHLRLYRLVQPWIERMPLMRFPGGPTQAEIAAARQAMLDFVARFNLFSLLRTFPVGVTSLMFGRMPVETPFGTAFVLESPSVLVVLGVGLGCILVGWCLGGCYLHWIAVATLQPGGRSLVRNVGWVLSLAILWSLLAGIFGLPALVLFGLLTAVQPLLGQGMLLLVSVFAIWLVLPIFFSPHGIYVEEQNAIVSILKSWHMVRYTLPSSGLFLAMAFIISEGTGYLWRLPPEDSWWTLVGVVGHAFVTTALLAASFVYYRDTNLWLRAVLERLSAQARSASA